MDRSDGTSRDPVAAAVRDPARRPAAPPCVRSAARRPLPGAHAAPASVSGKLDRHESTGRRCSARGRIAVQLVSCRGDDRPTRFHVDVDHDGRRAGRDDRRRDVRRRSPDHGHPSRRSRRTARAVFGVIHGDEQAGLQIVALLTELPVPPGVDLYLVDSMNPDGVARNTRGNANGVDLNRNFPYNWGPIGAAGRLAVRRAGSGERAGDPGRRRADHRAAPRPRDLVPPGSLHDRPRPGPRWGDPRPLRRAHRAADGNDHRRHVHRAWRPSGRARRFPPTSRNPASPSSSSSVRRCQPRRPEFTPRRC